MVCCSCSVSLSLLCFRSRVAAAYGSAAGYQQGLQSSSAAQHKPAHISTNCTATQDRARNAAAEFCSSRRAPPPNPPLGLRCVRQPFTPACYSLRAWSGRIPRAFCILSLLLLLFHIVAQTAGAGWLPPPSPAAAGSTPPSSAACDWRTFWSSLHLAVP